MGWEPPDENEFNREWLTPLEALDVSDEDDADAAEKWAILEQLRGGQIVAVARTAQINPTVAAVEPFVRVLPGAWRRMTQNDEFYFWKTGHLVVSSGATNAYGEAVGERERYFNVRFDPESFSGRPPSGLPPEQPPPPNPVEIAPASSAPAPNRGGRPAKAFWDDLLIEMTRQLYTGELQPKRQADIERAMHEWITARGFDAGETQVRERARKLWHAIEK